MKFPLISLVVSGGHTDLIYMEDNYSFKKIGGTLDDAVGECYDKVARVINVPYPGGPLVDKLSYEGNDTYYSPTGILVILLVEKTLLKKNFSKDHLFHLESSPYSETTSCSSVSAHFDMP